MCIVLTFVKNRRGASSPAARSAMMAPTTATATRLMSIAAIFSVLLLVATGTYPDAWAQTGSYVDSVTFIKQTGEAAAINGLINNDMDMYYHPISNTGAEQVRDAGHDVYTSVGGTVYSIYVNPTDDPSEGFNPFSLQGARYALNYMFDRDGIVDNLLGSGSTLLSPITPQQRDYLLVYKSMESLGISYDLDEADRLFEEALEAAGASKQQGVWYYDGQRLDVKVFIRNDDPIRYEIGQDLADNLEGVGFVVDRIYGDLFDTYDAVYGSDPADQGWHLYTEGWGGFSPFSTAESLLASYYAPWAENLPGGDDDETWTYQNEMLDALTSDLYYAKYNTQLERAMLVSHANTAGILESVRVFLATADLSHAVRDGVTGVVNAPGGGIDNKYTILNAQLPDGDLNLDVGVLHVAQSSWNPVGGLSDSYSQHAWTLLRDGAYLVNPHNADLVDSRNVFVSVEAAAGPDEKLVISDGAVIWDPNSDSWVAPDVMQATSKVVIDLRLSNWHHGIPMDVDDLLYLVYYSLENPEPGQRQDLVAVRVVDVDTIEVYIDYWDEDHDEIAARAGMWPSLPWEIHAAMVAVVDAGDAYWTSSAANLHNSSWLDMLDAGDAYKIWAQLNTFMSDDNHIQEFLYTDADEDARYAAATQWIDDKNHAVIGNGAFYLDTYTYDSNGAITDMTLQRFDDSSYPFEQGHWEFLTTSEQLAGTITIGSLASESGNAIRYGAEIRAAADLAISDFNEYLDIRGDSWRLNAERLDTETNPDVALQHLQTLNSQGIKIVDGPGVDIITRDVLDYADQNGMLLFSCCSSVPSNAISGDALFRMVPSQDKHAAAIVSLMRGHGVSHVVLVGLSAGWASELLAEAREDIKQMQGISAIHDDTILYDGVDGISDAVAELADIVGQAVDQYDNSNRIAVLHAGFGEGAEFLKAASAHDVLHDVQWFGADQNTAWPNIADDPQAAAFAVNVLFTSVQPSVVPGNLINNDIHSHLHSMGITPSPYSSYAYDTIWLLGLSILDAHSSDPADVMEQVPDTAKERVGAVGSNELDANGDLADTIYQAWRLVDGQWQEYNGQKPSEPPKSCRR